MERIRVKLVCKDSVTTTGEIVYQGREIGVVDRQPAAAIQIVKGVIQKIPLTTCTLKKHLHQFFPQSSTIPLALQLMAEKAEASGWNLKQIEKAMNQVLIEDKRGEL